MSTGKRGSSYSAIRKLGNRHFVQDKGSESFDIPEFVESNLDDHQSAEALADFFSSISQEFEPLTVDDLPPNLKVELEKGKHERVPVLKEFEVYKKITKAKKLFLET